MVFCLASSYKNLISALFFVLTVSSVALPTRAEPLLYPSSVHVALTDAEEKIMTEKSQQLLNLLSREEYTKVRELLHPDLAEQLTTEEIKEIWVNLIEKTGKVQKIVDYKAIDAVNSDLVIINAEFERGVGDFIVTFNEDEQIVGVDFPKVETITEISEKVIQSLAERKFGVARGYLHPLLKTEIFPGRVQEGWDRLQAQYGLFQRIVSTNVRAGSSVDNVNVVVMTLEFEKSTQDVLIIFDEGRRITGISLVE